MPWWGWTLAGITAAGLLFWLALRGWTSQQLRAALAKARADRRDAESNIRDAEHRDLDAIDATERAKIEKLREEHDAKVREIDGVRPDPGNLDGLVSRINEFVARFRNRRGG